MQGKRGVTVPYPLTSREKEAIMRISNERNSLIACTKRPWWVPQGVSSWVVLVFMMWPCASAYGVTAQEILTRLARAGNKLSQAERSCRSAKTELAQGNTESARTHINAAIANAAKAVDDLDWVNTVAENLPESVPQSTKDALDRKINEGITRLYDILAELRRLKAQCSTSCSAEDLDPVIVDLEDAQVTVRQAISIIVMYVPTVSGWGMAIIALLLLTGMTVKFGRRRGLAKTV